MGYQGSLYVREAVEIAARVESVFVSENNLQEVAEWCGSSAIHFCEDKDEWYIVFCGTAKIFSGSVVIKDEEGKFTWCSEQHYEAHYQKRVRS